jgi:hypothetical protein
MTRFTRLSCLLLPLLAAAFTTAAKPKGAEPPKTDKPRKVAAERVGLVLKVESNQLTVQTYGKARSELVIPVDPKTQVQVDGAPAALADVKPGMQVVVSPLTGTAQKILARQEGKKKKKDKGEKSPGPTPAEK